MPCCGDKKPPHPVKGRGISAEFMTFQAYYLKYDYREKDMAWGISMVIICCILIVLCFGLNTIVFRFYRKKASGVVSLMYTLLSFTDIVVAFGNSLTITCLILYLSLDMEFKEFDYVYPSVEYLCYFSFFISSIAIRVSIFLNATLTVVRTMMIGNPFSEPKKARVFISLGVIVFFWVIMTAGEVYTQKTINIELHWTEFVAQTKKMRLREKQLEKMMMNRKQYLYMWYYIFTSVAGYYHIVEFLGDRLPWSVDLYTVGFKVDEVNKSMASTTESAGAYIMFFLAFVIPTLIAIICLIAQAVFLKKSGVEGVENNNKKITKTIILLTVVFVICNTISIIYCSIASYTDYMLPSTSNDTTSDVNPVHNGKQRVTVIIDDEKIRAFYRSMFVFQQVLPLLNSTLSPMILIWRGSALRLYFKKTLKILPLSGN